MSSANTPAADAAAETVVDDNEQVQTALMNALSADQNAIAVAEQSRQRIEAANNQIADAEQKLRDANAAAEESWESLFNQMRDRVERSPVKGGVLGAKILPLLLLVASLVLFTGCGKSEPSNLPRLDAGIAELNTRVRLQGAGIDSLRDLLTETANANLKASATQAAEIGKLAEAVKIAERIATVETQQATLEDLAMQYRESVDGRLEAIESEGACPCGPGMTPCKCSRAPCCGVPVGPLPEALILPQPPPRNPASEADSPAPAELTPPAKKPARACPKRKPRD